MKERTEDGAELGRRADHKEMVRTEQWINGERPDGVTEDEKAGLASSTHRVAPHLRIPATRTTLKW